MKKIFLCAALCTLSLLSRADEGMWMLNRIDQKTAEAMKSLGLELTPDQLYSTEHASLKDCVVDFSDFCSGVVVSPNGLVFTNHHCGYGAIQSLSTPEDDILTNGFVAHSFKEERPAEGLFVKFLLNLRNNFLLADLLIILTLLTPLFLVKLANKFTIFLCNRLKAHQNPHFIKETECIVLIDTSLYLIFG